MSAVAKPGARANIILSSQVAQGLAVIGDRWAFLIIREIYLGVRRFEDLRERTQAARGTLASRLKSLVEQGILYKNPYQKSPIRYEYRLTDKGLDLYPVVLMMWRWEHDWGDHHYLPATLVHRSCGHDMIPVYRCRSCKLDIRPQDVTYSVGENFAAARKIPPRFQRRSRSSHELGGFRGPATAQALDCTGDRWTSLVMAAAFFGLQRFDDIAASIGIATNILSDRLKALTRMGIIDRIKYRERPARYEYRLSPKGRDVYRQTLAIHEWANRWLIAPGREPLLLHHTPCDRDLQGEVVCSRCEQALDPHEVTYRTLDTNG